MEAAVAASGQSFNGYNKDTRKPKFDRIYAIDIPYIELGVFHRSTVEEWNRPVHLWLKGCIHTRIVANPYLKTFITFFVSAIWHGFYPMFFYIFAFYSITTTNYSFIFKQFLNYKWLRSPIFYWLQFLHIKLSACYITTIFAIVVADHGMELVKGSLWIPISHVILYIIALLFDKKGGKPKPEWDKYSRIKINNWKNGEKILATAQDN